MVIIQSIVGHQPIYITSMTFEDINKLINRHTIDMSLSVDNTQYYSEPSSIEVLQEYCLKNGHFLDLVKL